MLNLENLQVQRGSFSLTVPSLTVAPGETVAVYGQSGSGKSSLLEAVAGFLPVRAGEIRVGDKSLLGLAPEKRRVGLVFQRAGLFSWMNLEDNVAFGLRVQGVQVDERRQRAREWLARVGLEGFGARYDSQISEGQAQRVALARALIVGFPVLLLDEPFSALDAQTKSHLRALISKLVKESSVAALLVSHDPDDVRALASKVLVLSEGRVQWSGKVSEWTP